MEGSMTHVNIQDTQKSRPGILVFKKRNVVIASLLVVLLSAAAASAYDSPSRQEDFLRIGTTDEDIAERRDDSTERSDTDNLNARGRDNAASQNDSTTDIRINGERYSVPESGSAEIQSNPDGNTHVDIEYRRHTSGDSTADTQESRSIQSEGYVEVDITSESYSTGSETNSTERGRHFRESR